jgi:CHRD domain
MKLKTMYLLTTTTTVFTIFSLLVLSNPPTNLNYYADAQSESRNHFFANLTNDGVLPSRAQPNTDGSGNATFTLLPDGNTMSYVLRGSNVGEVSGSNQSNIRTIALGYSTGPASFNPIYIFHLATTQGLITQGTGTMEGNFTSENFQLLFRGKSMSELVRSILDGNIYVRVVTIDHPLGEIGGKVQPLL